MFVGSQIEKEVFFFFFKIERDSRREIHARAPRSVAKSDSTKRSRPARPPRVTTIQEDTFEKLALPDRVDDQIFVLSQTKGHAFRRWPSRGARDAAARKLVLDLGDVGIVNSERVVKTSVETLDECLESGRAWTPLFSPAQLVPGFGREPASNRSLD